jgi:hypothetical protein
MITLYVVFLLFDFKSTKVEIESNRIDKKSNQCRFEIGVTKIESKSNRIESFQDVVFSLCCIVDNQCLNFALSSIKIVEFEMTIDRFVFSNQ